MTKDVLIQSVCKIVLHKQLLLLDREKKTFFRPNFLILEKTVCIPIVIDLSLTE